MAKSRKYQNPVTAIPAPPIPLEGWFTVDGGAMKVDDWTDLAAALKVPVDVQREMDQIDGDLAEAGDNWFDDGNVELIVSTDGKVADSGCDFPGMEIDANHPGWHPYHPYAVHWYEFGNDHDVRTAPERMSETMNGIFVMAFLASLKSKGRRGWAVMLPK